VGSGSPFREMVLLLPLAGGLLAWARAAAAVRCTDDEGCNLNGICRLRTGTCACVPEWTGADCGVLNLLPARPSPRSGYDEPGTSSWGGSIVEDGGRYHMMVSRFKGHCGLNAWQQNSEIIHAVSVFLRPAVVQYYPPAHNTPRTQHSLNQTTFSRLRRPPTFP
jgi:hypothetical protein